MPDTPQTPLMTPPHKPTASNRWTFSRIAKWTSVLLSALVILIFVIGLLLALFTNAQDMAPRIQVIRDIIIIIMALEFILIILALAVLILQIARLINLLQNEIKPILQNTQDTVNSAKGTVDFVGQNLAGPLIQISSFLAGLMTLVRELMGIRRALRPSKRESKHESG